MPESAGVRVRIRVRVGVRVRIRSPAVYRLSVSSPTRLMILPISTKLGPSATGHR